MKVETVSKDACVIIIKREQAKELYKELTSILTKIREGRYKVTRVMEKTTHPEGKVEYLINGMSKTKVKNLIIKTLEEEVNKRLALA
ncbi:MAG: hypothetical protein KZY55_02795 [Paeniclostridium sp.]|nr:hypothetical protein [Paeniclostridium sp.]MBW4862272.1 hypothetical protein [Paeniclostridium sp.]MBW4872962.1 hypothetical protein [Paeniclostridium sp.]